jgi:hypothetical protein
MSQRPSGHRIDHQLVRVRSRQFVFERQLDHSFALSREYTFGRRKYAFNTLSGSGVETRGVSYFK